MLEDSVKLADLDDQLRVIDLASLVLRTLPALPAEPDSAPDPEPGGRSLTVGC
jgi:hypothetical protein